MYLLRGASRTGHDPARLGDAAETTLRIGRLDGGTLVIEGGGLAAAFFSVDPSSIGVGSYDSLAGRTTSDSIETSDLQALNRTMRARTAHDRWATITGIHLPWLHAIDPDLDLIEADDQTWNRADAEALIGAALSAVIGPGRGASVGTKMLHLKRPRLFPVIDQLVAQMLGAQISEAPADVRARQAARLVVHLRGQGRNNIDPLRRIQRRLAGQNVQRSLVRILDAILWSSHPAVSFRSVHRVLACRVEDG
jgi:Family of unknown function (DUF6308)